ncbi:DUF480 domain-containing protein [Gammaproteobacteria bacterium 42_54_T18]|nr:DUF480 domain-containing protein [Gammaproteobacteria bacterium 42_54_T18]
MAIKIELENNEQRVLGCLIEKEITTPDQYPLSLNALTNACNQKSNRDPVMTLSEADVLDTLHQLKEKHLLTLETGFGSRVVKYRHRFCNTEFGELKLSSQELAILCVMFLRGPQTPGELRTRTNRLCEFSDVSVVDSVLNTLSGRNDGPFVTVLDREPGKRDSRYAHLFGQLNAAEITLPQEPQSTSNTPSNIDSNSERIDYLELRVDELENKLADILERLR